MKQMKMFGTSANLIVNLFGGNQEDNYTLLKGVKNITPLMNKYQKVKSNNKDLTVILVPSEFGMSEETQLDIEKFLSFGYRVITFNYLKSKNITITKIGKDNQVLHQELQPKVINKYLRNSNIINLIFEADNEEMFQKLISKFIK